jgi:hypothetical protein
MSHAVRSTTAVRSTATLAFRLTLAVLLAAGIAVALILTIDGGKDQPTVASPPQVSSVARPDEGLAPITKPASSSLDVQSLFEYPSDSAAPAAGTRPDEGLAPIAKADAPTPDARHAGLILRSKAWNQHLGLH